MFQLNGCFCRQVDGVANAMGLPTAPLIVDICMNYVIVDQALPWWMVTPVDLLCHCMHDDLFLLFPNQDPLNRFFTNI